MLQPKHLKSIDLISNSYGAVIEQILLKFNLKCQKIWIVADAWDGELARSAPVLPFEKGINPALRAITYESLQKFLESLYINLKILIFYMSLYLEPKTFRH